MAVQTRTLIAGTSVALFGAWLWWASGHQGLDATVEPAGSSALREHVQAEGAKSAAGSDRPGRVPADRIEPASSASARVELAPDAPQPEVALSPLALVTTGEVTEGEELAVEPPAARPCRVQLSNGACGDPLPGDRDADGFKTKQDCDDTLRQVHPGANEVRCNGIDEDCSGADLCPADRDGDGFGADEDCDDRNAARNPRAVEVPCNGVDEDCSGIDACDRDGDGDPAPQDCDDANAARHTMGKEVICDGIDQNCDGADCCDGDADHDGSPCKLDCDDKNPRARPGAPRAVGCGGEDLDCDGKPDGEDCKIHHDDH